MLTKQRIDELHRVALRLYKFYGLKVLGEDSIWPFSGPDGHLDYRISDVEHLFHELAHPVIAGLPDLRNADLMTRWQSHSHALSEEESSINEAKVYSVVYDILKANGITERELAGVYDCLSVVFTGADTDLDELFETYGESVEGHAAVGDLIVLFNEEIKIANREGRKPVEKLLFGWES